MIIRISDLYCDSAYIVPANPSSLPTEADKASFATSVQEWIRNRVARHKYLRGGCVVIDIIPKRYSFSMSSLLLSGILMQTGGYSAAGKILRRELRVRAAKELEGTPKARL
jgi:4-coumarate--CoA ligase